MRNTTLAVLALAVFLAPLAANAGNEPPVTTTRVAAGLSSALYVTSPPGDFERLFIVEQNTARIRILRNGAVLATPFIDLNSKASSGGERGLLGLAFHPQYRDNGYFFVNYTNNAGATIVERYTVQASNPNIANPASAKLIIQINQPFSNHNGGCIQFGPDGYLYIATGDGGSGNDPQGNGQRTTTLLGKMLRLDIDTVGAYAIPADNPFVGQAPRDEIWSLGWRNPWRFSFDRLNGDMYVGDVGQSAAEEISWESGSDTGGGNYGWRCMEGLLCTGLSGCVCNDNALTDPIHQHANAGSNCTVVGGYNYRGCAIPEIDGTYFLADYCSGNLWSFKWDGTTKTDFRSRNSDLDPNFQIGGFGVRSYGEDAYGEVYIVEGNEIWKIIRDQSGVAVTVRFIPQGYEAVPGGDFNYTIQATNHTSSPVQVEGWIDVLPQDGTPSPFGTNPKIGPKTKTIQANATLTKNLRLRVPGSVPAGATPYVLRMALGNFTSGTLDTVDCLGFNVVNP